MIATTPEKENTTVGKGTFDLVKGTFSPMEASEIVNDLFFKKINFHELRSFSQLIRFGAEESDTQERINELRKTQRQASQLVAEAEKAGKSLRVNSTISIEII